MMMYFLLLVHQFAFYLTSLIRTVQFIAFHECNKGLAYVTISKTLLIVSRFGLKASAECLNCKLSMMMSRCSQQKRRDPRPLELDLGGQHQAFGATGRINLSITLTCNGRDNGLSAL